MNVFGKYVNSVKFTPLIKACEVRRTECCSTMDETAGVFRTIDVTFPLFRMLSRVHVNILEPTSIFCAKSSNGREQSNERCSQPLLAVVLDSKVSVE